MSIFSRIISAVFNKPTPKAHGFTGNYQNQFSISYDGEKNMGEIGPVKEYWPNYDVLRLRSWQSYLDSEITQTVINKFTKWVIGSGLKLQSEPNKSILDSEGVKLDYEKFTTSVEARFSIHAKSRKVDSAQLKNLNKIAKKAKLNAIIGGDVLVILRYDKSKKITVQLVDGCHVKSPYYGTDLYGQALKNGNILKHGIEMSKSGQHVAYYVQNRDLSFKRIRSTSVATGLTTAFMVYGMEYRLDNHRGIPLISAVMETLKKLERYKEATVGSAEERQKIAYTIVHGLGSTGENPLAKNIAKAFNANANDDIPSDTQGKALADKVAATTNKQTFNMPPDSKMEQLESKNELHFKDFYSVNIDLVCAALGIPPEVALSKYDSNFSASRAALKDWEHTLSVEREDFTDQFYQPIYNYWLHTEILKNKVQAPGYLAAVVDKNEDVMESFRQARFIGAGVPHVDPVKEVKAERAKLGELGKNIPLTTVEKATEALNTGDSYQNLSKYAKEVTDFNKLNLVEEDKPSVEKKEE